MTGAMSVFECEFLLRPPKRAIRASIRLLALCRAFTSGSF
jgi:hypothetical protein